MELKLEEKLEIDENTQCLNSLKTPSKFFFHRNRGSITDTAYLAVYHFRKILKNEYFAFIEGGLNFFKVNVEVFL